jgi:hypothetical protein
MPNTIARAVPSARLGRMIRFAVSALSLLASACAADWTVDFRPELSADQAFEFGWAAAEWCGATAGSCCPTLDGRINTVTMADGLASGNLGKTYARDGLEPRIRIVVSTDVIDAVAWYRVVRHELGHACRVVATGGDTGGWHLPEGNAMAPSIDQWPVALTALDALYAKGRL